MVRRFDIGRNDRRSEGSSEGFLSRGGDLSKFVPNRKFTRCKKINQQV